MNVWNFANGTIHMMKFNGNDFEINGNGTDILPIRLGNVVLMSE